MGAWDPPGSAAQQGDTGGGNFLTHAWDWLSDRGKAQGGQSSLTFNLLNDVGQAVHGIWTLGGSAIHDFTGATEWLGYTATGQHDKANGVDFIGDDLWQALSGTGKFKQQGSAVLNDYQNRYGGGGRSGVAGWTANTGHELYDHPLSFITDALTVATAGGFAAEKGADIAAKVGGVAETLDTASTAAKAGEVADVAGQAAGVATDTADAGKVATLANPASNAVSAGQVNNTLSRFVQAVKGQEYRFVDGSTGKVTTVGQAINPARRILYQNRFLNMVSGDSEWAKAQALKLGEKAAASANPQEQFVLLQRAERLRAAAEKAAEVGARVYKPGYSNFVARKAVDFIVGQGVGKSQKVQSAVLQSFDQHLGSLDPAVYRPEDIVDGMTGIDTTYTNDHIAAPAGHGNRDTEVFNGQVSQRVLGQPVRFAGEDPVVTFDQAKKAAEEGTAAVDTSPTLPAPGTPGRAEFDAARAAGQEDISTVVPKLREVVGNQGKVAVAGLKDEGAIKRSASLVGGTWRDVQDAGGRARVVLSKEDAYSAKAVDSLAQRIEKATGMKLRRLEWSVDSPDAFGARGARMVFETADGKRPFEVQVLSDTAARIHDGTTVTRHTVDALALKAKLGLATPDDLLRIQALKNEMQDLWAATTDEIRPLRGGPEASLLRQRANQFRIDTYAHTTDPFIGRGLDPLSAFRNRFKPLQYRNGAHFDPKAKATVDAPDAFTLHDTLAKEGMMQPQYYPMMDENLLGERAALLKRGANRTTATLGKDRNLAQNTGALIDAARYSKDPRAVWRLRAAQSGRLQERLDTVFSMVGEYGRPLKNVNDVGFDEEVFVPGLVKRIVEEHNALMDHLANDPSGQGLGDLLRKMTDDNSEELQKLLDSNGDLEAFAVPKVVAERMRAHANLGIPNKDMDIVFGTPTRMWKSMVLAGSPRWVVNNLLGNVVFLKLQGGKLGDVVHQLDKSWKKKLIENLGPMEEHVGGGSLYHTHVDEARYFAGDTTLSRMASSLESKTHNGMFRRSFRTYSQWAQRINSNMEDAFRRASALTEAERVAARHDVQMVSKGFWGSNRRMEAAFRTGLDEKQWREVVSGVNKTMNDYATASPLVRGIVRPYIAPFWSFYRHAAKTLLTMPFDHPAKFRLMQLLGEADDERMRQAGIDPEAIPSWMRSGALFTGRGQAGEYRFVSTAGMNPFNTVLDTPMNILHPAWKMLYEDGTGRSTFTGRQFTDPNVTASFGSENLYKVDPNTHQETRVDKVAPGLIEHLLQQVPQYEMVKDLVAGGTTYDTTNLLDAFRARLSGEPSQAVLVDPVTGEPRVKKDIGQALMKTFGYSAYDVNAQKLEDQMLKEKAAALQAWYREHPDIVQQPTPSTTSSSQGWG